MSEITLQLLADSFWSTLEARFLKIIECALLKLRSTDDLPETEVELNRLLYSHLLTASREICPENMIAPVMECTNQPDPDDEAELPVNTRGRIFNGYIWIDMNQIHAAAASNL